MIGLVTAFRILQCKLFTIQSELIFLLRGKGQNVVIPTLEMPLNCNEFVMGFPLVKTIQKYQFAGTDYSKFNWILFTVRCFRIGPVEEEQWPLIMLISNTDWIKVFLSNSTACSPSLIKWNQWSLFGVEFLNLKKEFWTSSTESLILTHSRFHSILTR